DPGQTSAKSGGLSGDHQAHDALPLNCTETLPFAGTSIFWFWIFYHLNSTRRHIQKEVRATSKKH
ncbi:MAG: hypothetical protein J2P54_06220, partial [Bradyrhizobiaceae bacterium]|nr:hypothetical protein [Bradyrhizobiaceae bacterium]